MKNRHLANKILSVFLLLLLTLIWGCKTETNEQLLGKLNNGLKTGSFLNQPEALDALSTLLNRNYPKAKDPGAVDCLVQSEAHLLTDDAQWTNPHQAREIYNVLQQYDNATVIDGLVRGVVNKADSRLHVLFLSVKLGIPGSEKRLDSVLYKHGDKKMAEDFLNSGSAKLYDGGKRWANSHDYSITQGMSGSHRVSWGRF